MPRSVPGRAPKHLLAVPVYVLDLGLEFLLLRRTEIPVSQVEHFTESLTLPAQLVGHQHPVRAQLRLKADGAPVERLVVKGAEGETVGDSVGAAVRVPPDVRGIETERGVSKAQVEVADGASALVSRSRAFSRL